jgi:hypothetical protein
MRYDGVLNFSKHCRYTLNVYHSIEYRESLESCEPALLVVVVVAVLFFKFIVFGVYDAMAQRRLLEVLATALQTTAIVKSLFPNEVANPLLEEAEQN